MYTFLSQTFVYGNKNDRTREKERWSAGQKLKYLQTSTTLTKKYHDSTLKSEREREEQTRIFFQWLIPAVKEKGNRETEKQRHRVTCKRNGNDRDGLTTGDLRKP